MAQALVVADAEPGQGGWGSLAAYWAIWIRPSAPASTAHTATARIAASSWRFPRLRR